MHNYDVIVVGAGHAGIEAALSLAHRNFNTLLITINIDNIAKMPCNPSIGGPAKGIVVREIDALGGMMPKVADKTALQFKMLNTTKGPGVWSLRVQSDKLAYSRLMKEICLNTSYLTVLKDVVEEIIVENKEVKGVVLQNNTNIYANAVILTTGTYMDSCIMVSSKVTPSGPDGEQTTKNLSESLRKAGLELFRLKTGTPARIKTNSIDFSKTSYEPGTDEFLAFSNETESIKPFSEQKACYLTYTTKETLKIINDNLDKSSMYSGVVKGVGPRYCPSIEDKIVRFKDKERHQIFLEPESLELDTTYVQGFSTSMPYDVQDKMLKSLIGLENCVIDKYAYAIEYDAINPLQVKASLECKEINNLFIAGQILGTSGYEEAAGLGLMAGINCGLKLQGKEALVLGRDESYIGVMIDDLVTKGTKEPYRLLTSRAEYRLLLRHDNADQRLGHYGYEVGTLKEDNYLKLVHKIKELERIKEELKLIRFTSKSEEINEYLKSINYEPISEMITAYDIIKRPEVKVSEIAKYIDIIIEPSLMKQIEIEVKYEGYIEKAKKEARRMLKMDKMKLPEDLNYDEVPNLSLEARQKLNQTKPRTLGQASRISGINPSDIQVIAIYMKRG